MALDVERHLDNKLGDMIIEQARSWLGTSYHHQGRLKKAANHNGGVDCLGLVMGVARELGLREKSGRLFSEFDRSGYSEQPDNYELEEFLALHLAIVKFEEIAVGDILSFRFIKYSQHVGIVSDFLEGRLGLIHCYRNSACVVEHHLSASWQKAIAGVYRFPEQVIKSRS